MPLERASAYSGNKRPHNQLGLVPLKKLKNELGNQIAIRTEEKKVTGPRHMLKYTGPINRALVEQDCGFKFLPYQSFFESSYVNYASYVKKQQLSKN